MCVFPAYQPVCCVLLPSTGGDWVSYNTDFNNDRITAMGARLPTTQAQNLFNAALDFNSTVDFRFAKSIHKVGFLWQRNISLIFFFDFLLSGLEWFKFYSKIHFRLGRLLDEQLLQEHACGF